MDVVLQLFPSGKLTASWLLLRLYRLPSLKRLIGPYVLAIAGLQCDHQTLPCVSDDGFTRHLVHHPGTPWPLLGYIPDRSNRINA